MLLISLSCMMMVSPDWPDVAADVGMTSGYKSAISLHCNTLPVL